MKTWLLAAVMIGFSAWAACAQGYDEYQDPVGTVRPTQLVGMHACDGPHLMSGVNVGKNLLLCLGVTGAVDGDVFRTIDTATYSTVDGVHQVRTCGPLKGTQTEFAMKGIYNGGINPPLMTCSKVSNLGQVHIDTNTQRDGMHACPVGEIMVGIKLSGNLLACAEPPP